MVLSLGTRLCPTSNSQLPKQPDSLEVGNWKLGGICVPGPTYDHERRGHEAHEDNPLRRRNPNAFNWLAWSVARTPDRVISPVVRIGRGRENGFPQTIPTHRGTEAQRLRECRVALGGAGGARDARDGASDRAITSGTTASRRL